MNESEVQPVKDQAEPKSNWFKRFCPTSPWLRGVKWIGLLIIIVLLGATWAVMTFVVHPKGSGGSMIDNIKTATGNYPKCPSNLSGILTYQLMDPKYIGAMIPLGNVAPPGHTSPVDHIYFEANTDGHIPLYAPADGWITHVMANSTKKDAGSDYVFDSYVITYTICDGLVLDFAGYTGINQSLQDELAKHSDECKSGITKVGHDDAGEQQCDYQDLNFKVTSGETIGYTERTKTAEGGYNLPFEIWTADYNLPSPAQTDWSYYGDDRYAHNYCTFDLYSGDLKNQFDAKFGDYNTPSVKNSDGTLVPGTAVFKPRTVAPLCGTLDQDVVGTIQGMWFSHKPDPKGYANVDATGQGISFLHNNIDPTKGEVVVGGELSNNIAGILEFDPTHSGTVNREPSEIKADGSIYCYPGHIQTLDAQNNSFDGKILVQLVDDHHLKVENQSGTCGASESFKTAYNFSR